VANEIQAKSGSRRWRANHTTATAASSAPPDALDPCSRCDGADFAFPD
jgi:hypothetical protein